MGFLFFLFACGGIDIAHAAIPRPPARRLSLDPPTCYPTGMDGFNVSRRAYENS
jgi:hypothetical protein